MKSRDLFMIKDTLQDIVAHTQTLGILPTVKVTGTATSTSIESIADDKSVILQATVHKPVSDFIGVFGLPNLDKLNIHLKCPEYSEDGHIQVVNEVRDGVEVPTSLHFENAAGDFSNDYRFMSTAVINEKIKNAIFNGAQWKIAFEPTLASIMRLKYQSAAHSNESVLTVSTKKGNLVFSFGDVSTHSGSFVFHELNADETLKYSWSWPVHQIIQILGLVGTKTMNISDVGAMQIIVDSGIAEYKYILPAMSIK
jgi:hypothetical protein